MISGQAVSRVARTDVREINWGSEKIAEQLNSSVRFDRIHPKGAHICAIGALESFVPVAAACLERSGNFS